MKAGVDYTGVTVFFWLHDGKGNWLFGKRSQNCRDERGAWDSGGGKLEFGEGLEEGARREIREEYGCTNVKIEQQLTTASRVREHNGVKTHWISTGFIGLIDPAEVKNGDPESIDELGWFRLDALPEPLHSCVKLDLEENRAAFEKYA